MTSVDLPQPDSPTRPKLSPGAMSSEKSGITTRRPAEVRYSTRRFLIDSSVIEPLLCRSRRPLSSWVDLTPRHGGDKTGHDGVGGLIATCLNPPATARSDRRRAD